jgi:hypothetical protein
MGRKKRKSRGDRGASDSQTARSRAVTADAPAAAEQPAIVVEMGDAGSHSTLIEGFHEVEEGAWRWTEKHCVLLIALPAEAARAGAVFRFKFTIPEPAAARYGSQTISAKIGSTLLAEQHFDTAGDYEFCADIPAEALSGDLLRLELALGKSFVPEGDGRELGVIAERATLEAK